MLNGSRQAATIVAVLAALSTGRAQAADAPEATPRITLAPSSRLVLHGKSTMHDFTSKATRLELAVEVAEVLPAGPTPLARLSGEGTVKSLVLTVPVEALKSEKEGLDKNMYKALKASANPNIVFRMAPPAVARDDARKTFHVAGELEVAGQRRPVQVGLQAAETPEGIVLEGSTPLLMSEFGIKPPSMFLGTLKTQDRVVVEWRLVLTSSGF